MSDYDIVAFIRARLYDDQFSAEIAAPEWPPGDEVAGQVESILVGAHAFRHDPARVLRGVKAKRRIVDLWTTFLDGYDGDEWRLPEHARDTLRLLAFEWSTHEDYRAEWTP